jgi:hypothetical protein
MDAIARAGANGLMDPVEPVRTLFLLRQPLVISRRVSRAAVTQRT